MLEPKTDLTELMKCKNCKFYRNGCERVSNTFKPEPESTCVDWTQAEVIKEDEKLIESKEVYRLMYHEIINVLKGYLVLEEDNYKFMALWILGTYTHENFNTYPYLFLNAMRGSGKTRTLKLISALGANGDGSVENNLTEACLFRIPRGRTTCIDEIEQIGNKEKQTLRELLNAAYKKGMKVRRMKKSKKKNEEGHLEEVQVAEEFEPYFPIAMANINGIDEVLADRAITLILEKSDNPEKTRKVEDFLENTKIRWIKLTLSQFSDVVTFLTSKKHIEKWNFWLSSHYNVTNNTNYTNYTNVTNVTIQKYLDMITKDNNLEIDKDMEKLFIRLNESSIVGRNFELFMPLLILAEFIGEDIFEDIFRISKDIVKERKSEEYNESKDVSLFHYVLSKEEEIEGHYISIKRITNEFKDSIESNSKDDEINDKWIGRALKRLNLILDKRKMSSGREVTLNYAKAREKLKIFL